MIKENAFPVIMIFMISDSGFPCKKKTSIYSPIAATMKWLMLLLSFMLSRYALSQVTTTDLSRLDWLVGTWERTNGRAGRTSFEKWEEVKPGELKGIGFFVQGADTTITERLKIVWSGNDLNYIADVTGNREPVFFRFTKLELHHFICENPSHDFPKRIEYQWNETELNATISGDGKSVTYRFRKR